MKTILSAVLLMFFCSMSHAQDNDIKVEKKGELTEVTYYHDNGEIQQTGYFNEEGKLDGVWKSYDITGKKIAVGNYKNGRKVGKWFFWTDNSLNEVDFIDSRIINVSEWKNKTKVVTNE